MLRRQEDCDRQASSENKPIKARLRSDKALDAVHLEPGVRGLMHVQGQ